MTNTTWNGIKDIITTLAHKGYATHSLELACEAKDECRLESELSLIDFDYTLQCGIIEDGQEEIDGLKEILAYGA